MNWKLGNCCRKCFTEPFIGILEYVIKKETLEEMKMNYVYEDDTSSLHPKRVSCGIPMRLIYLILEVCLIDHVGRHGNIINVRKCWVVRLRAVGIRKRWYVDLENKRNENEE